jgi:hypothetical protein
MVLKMPPKTNSKVVAALAKKDAAQALKDSQAAAAQEKKVEAEWKVHFQS